MPYSFLNLFKMLIFDMFQPMLGLSSGKSFTYNSWNYNWFYLVVITNKMQLGNGIYYSLVH